MLKKLLVNKVMRIFWMVFLTLSSLSTALAANSIKSIRVWPAPENTRVVFDLGAKPDFKYFTLSAPNRLVIDFKNTKNATKLASVAKNDKRILKVRTSTSKSKGTTRLVMELASPYQLTVFPLAPAGQYGNRLVVDLFDKSRSTKKVNLPANNERDIVIAIVAGHGGDDPGSIGARGTYEKHVTLKIAKRIAALVNKKKGLKAVMVRTGDYYVPHERKPQIARQNRADLLISIHADAFTSSQPSGASVLVQSSRRANSEFTRWIANRQKESEMLGGAGETIKKTKDKNLALTLADMKKEHTMASSYEFAEHVISQLKKVTKMHKKKPEGLSLAVLKSSDIPSVLIETGFISNHQEEKNLNSPTHQQKLAKAIYNSIDNYFINNAPDGTYYASRSFRNHKVVRGESLSVVAQRYNVSVNTIKTANNLKSDTVRIGQNLRIPRAD